jgi:hypothetical protein
VAPREEMSGLDYTVHLSAQVGATAADMMLGDRLLTALEDLEKVGRLAAPVTTQDTRALMSGATFCVTAADANEAVSLAATAFREALAAAGVDGKPRIVEIEAHEDHEEAAALG